MSSIDKVARADSVVLPNVESNLPDNFLPRSFEGAGAFYFVLPWPISANVYLSKGKRFRSAKGKLWADAMGGAIWKQVGSARAEPLMGNIAVYHEIWPPDDNRKRDLDNFTGKHIQDMYQRTGLISDDSQVKIELKYWHLPYKTGALVAHLLEI